MMRNLCHALLALAALGLVVNLASAQARPGGGGGGGVGQLLDDKAVQKELKLTDEQIAALKKANDAVREKHMDDFAKLRDVPMEERGKKFAELGKQMYEEFLKGQGDTLKADQLKRFKQLRLQQSINSPFGGGPAIFLDVDVVKELKITDKQKEDLKTIADDFQKEARELLSGGFNPDNFKKMAEMRDEKVENATKTLTDDQKKAWKEMTGEKFTFTPPMPRRPQ
jgi:Spy/CpxP family protein refolding chaperone